MSSDTPLRTKTRLFICAPVPLGELRFFPHPPNAFMLGLIHSFSVSIEGPERGRITITRLWKRTAESLIFPSTKFFSLMRADLNIPPGHGFNILYETIKEVEMQDGPLTPADPTGSQHKYVESNRSWVPSHGLYLEGCDDSTATRSWMVDKTGEYEVTTLSFNKCQELTPEDIRSYRA